MYEAKRFVEVTYRMLILRTLSSAGQSTGVNITGENSNVRVHIFEFFSTNTQIPTSLVRSSPLYMGSRFFWATPVCTKPNNIY